MKTHWPKLHGFRSPIPSFLRSIFCIVFLLSSISPQAQPTRAQPLDPTKVYLPAVLKGDPSYTTFLKRLVNPTTGLACSRENESFTTLYKNSLAAIAFIYGGDISLAERIFDFYLAHRAAPFNGFNQNWNCQDGTTTISANTTCDGRAITSPWEGDNAFLLLALEHYAKLTGGFGRYSSLASALTGWLTLRANSGDKIIPEGVADVYAALQPVGSDWANWNTLSKLYNQFYTDTDPRCRVNLASVADHTTRDVLVFGNPTGLASINTFKRTEAWALDPTVTVTALSAFASENFINTEISAQWLLAARMAQPSSPDITWLQGGLEALKLPRQPALDYAGIPYTVTHHNFANDYSLPILDTTAYMVFYGRGLNPFAAGSNPGCPYDKFIPLTIAGQAQAFPRLYSTGQSFKTFPQEINDGSHKNVVIEFTPSVTLTTPLTLTIDTVARGNFEIGVTLDGGSHCLSAGDSQVASIPISGSTVSIQLASVPVGASAHQAYQLVLTGNHGWGVFDWLQLKNADGQVVWEIGARDQHCSEFDNTGFSYPCS